MYRAFYAMPPLDNAQGTNVGALVGFMTNYRKLTNMYGYLPVVVLDPKGKTFRDRIEPTYKANRQETPEELGPQFPLLKELMELHGIPWMQIDDFEADDVIASLTQQLPEVDHIIASNDKDLMQLVDERVRVLRWGDASEFGPEQVRAKFGVGPEQMIDFQALTGDSVDNLPDVRGVGPKTAAGLLGQFGTLEGIIEAVGQNAELPTRTPRQALQEAIADGSLAKTRQLVCLRTDVELPAAMMQMQTVQAHFASLSEEEKQAIQERLDALEIKRGLFEIEGAAEAEASGADVGTTLALPLKSASELAQLGIPQQLQQAEKVVLWGCRQDMEDLQSPFACLGLMTVPSLPSEASAASVSGPKTEQQSLLGQTCAWFCQVADLHKEDGKLATQLAQMLSEVPSQRWLVPGLRETRRLFWEAGGAVAELSNLDYSQGDDPLLMSYLLAANGRQHTLEGVAEVLPIACKPWKSIVAEWKSANKGRGRPDLQALEGSQIGELMGSRLTLGHLAYEHFAQQIQEEDKLDRLYRTVELPMAGILAKMEMWGVHVEQEKLEQLSEDLAAQAKTIEQVAFAEAKREFKLNSPADVGKVLYDELELPSSQRKTKGGQKSTDVNALEDLIVKGYRLPELILQWRSVSKLRSTYTEALVGYINATSGRVHTHWQERIVATGRLSSTAPNLQNIPIRTEQGRLIRQAFTARPGWKLIAADYSQIELRIMAHFSQETAFLEAFASGRDIHQITAAEVFGVAVDAVSAEQRRSAKAINFGLIYGMSAFTLSRQLKIPRKEAGEYLKSYFEHYPQVKEYTDSIRQQTKESGMVETFFGRRLHFPHIRGKNPVLRAAAERAAINAPMQGTAADIIKLAMIAVDRRFATQSIELYPVLQIHDELVFEVRDDASMIDEASQMIREEMEGVAHLLVPLQVVLAVGNNWSEAH